MRHELADQMDQDQNINQRLCDAAAKTVTLPVSGELDQGCEKDFNAHPRKPKKFSHGYRFTLQPSLDQLEKTFWVPGRKKTTFCGADRTKI